MNIYLKLPAKMKLMNNPVRETKGNRQLHLRDCHLIFAITVRKNECIIVQKVLLKNEENITVHWVPLQNSAINLKYMVEKIAPNMQCYSLLQPGPEDLQILPGIKSKPARTHELAPMLLMLDISKNIDKTVNLQLERNSCFPYSQPNWNQSSTRWRITSLN